MTLPKNSKEVIIFADGACRGNPGPGGWGSIMAVLPNQVEEFGGREALTTNNRMELKAVIEALKRLSFRDIENYRVRIYSDSKYVNQGITKWIHGWKRKGWKTLEGDVKNRDLWEELSRLVDQVEEKIPQKMDWIQVEGHRGIPGNERCDEIAVDFADNKFPALYSGALSVYPIDLFDLSPKYEKPKKSSSVPLGPDGYYLSFVDGKIYRDKAWKECEGRVKGRRGAKFKKCARPQDEPEILKAWGVSSKKS